MSYGRLREFEIGKSIENLPNGVLAANLLMRREIAGFLLTENSFRSGMKLSRHHLPLAYLCLVHQGTFPKSLATESASVDHQHSSFIQLWTRTRIILAVRAEVASASN
jgi:hypothetical protein